MVAFDITQIITTAFANLISGLIQNVVWILLIIWAVRTIAREVPSWLDRWENIKIKQKTIDRALEGRNKYGKN